MCTIDPDIERRFETNRSLYEAQSSAINERLRTQRQRIAEAVKQADTRLANEGTELLDTFVKQNRKREQDSGDVADKAGHVPNPWLAHRDLSDTEFSFGPEGDPEEDPEEDEVKRLPSTRPSSGSSPGSRRRRPAVDEEEEDFSIRFDSRW